MCKIWEMRFNVAKCSDSSLVDRACVLKRTVTAILHN